MTASTEPPARTESSRFFSEGDTARRRTRQLKKEGGLSSLSREQAGGARGVYTAMQLPPSGAARLRPSRLLKPPPGCAASAGCGRRQQVVVLRHEPPRSPDKRGNAPAASAAAVKGPRDAANVIAAADSCDALCLKPRSCSALQARREREPRPRTAAQRQIRAVPAAPATPVPEKREYRRSGSGGARIDAAAATLFGVLGPLHTSRRRARCARREQRRGGRQQAELENGRASAGEKEQRHEVTDQGARCG